LATDFILIWCELILPFCFSFFDGHIESLLVKQRELIFNIQFSLPLVLND